MRSNELSTPTACKPPTDLSCASSKPVKPVKHRCQPDVRPSTVALPRISRTSPSLGTRRASSFFSAASQIPHEIILYAYPAHASPTPILARFEVASQPPSSREPRLGRPAPAFRIRTPPRTLRTAGLKPLRACSRSSPGDLCAMMVVDGSGSSICHPRTASPVQQHPRSTPYSTAQYIHTWARTAARRVTSCRIVSHRTTVAPSHRRPVAPCRRLDVVARHPSHLPSFLPSFSISCLLSFLSSLLSFLPAFLPSAAPSFPHPGFSPPFPPFPPPHKCVPLTPTPAVLPPAVPFPIRVCVRTRSPFPFSLCLPGVGGGGFSVSCSLSHPARFPATLHALTSRACPARHGALPEPSPSRPRAATKNTHLRRHR